MRILLIFKVPFNSHESLRHVFGSGEFLKSNSSKLFIFLKNIF